MGKLKYIMALIGVLALMVGAAGCGTGSAGLRSFSERYLDEGHANRMVEYGRFLYKKGMIREAHAAFLQAENMAYTYALRVQSREQRMYLQRQIAALERGDMAPPPVPNLDDRIDSPVVKGSLDPTANQPPPPWVTPKYESAVLLNTKEQTPGGDMKKDLDQELMVNSSDR
jgi:hypothetical protein